MRRFPLDVLLVNDDPHSYDPAGALHRLLHKHPSVRSYGIASANKALQFLREGKVNTLFVSPGLSYSANSVHPIRAFIATVEKEMPRVVVVLYAMHLSRLIHDEPSLASYFSMDAYQAMSDEAAGRASLDRVLAKCDEWHKTRFEYDVALSFAGENRQFVEEIAQQLARNDVRVFYDGFEQADLLGRDLYTHLYEIYAKRSRYCVIVASAHYAQKMWTTHERRAAQERTLQERGGDYVIPVRIDDAEIPGLLSTIGCVPAGKSPKQIAELIVNKLWLTEPLKHKKYIGYSLYDYDVEAIHARTRRAHPEFPSLYIPPSMEYELIRDREENQKVLVGIARTAAIERLKEAFPSFMQKLESMGTGRMDEIRAGASANEVAEVELDVEIALPTSYKRFLQITRGFWLLKGAIQLDRRHPFVLRFRPLDELSKADRRGLSPDGRTGTGWPPQTDGMLCFGGYFLHADGDLVVFDTRRGLVGGEYPVYYSQHARIPATATRVCASFEEWLNEHCIDDMLAQQSARTDG